ncbi:MAG: hypothetical protein AMXMBFR64_48640 [Myxococcales bacterium]
MQTDALMQLQQAGLVDVDASIFFQAVIFLVTVLTLNALVFRPLQKVVDLRYAKIQGTIAEAKRTEKDAADRVARWEAQIVEARRQGTDRQREIRDRAAARASEITAEGSRTAESKLNEMMPRLTNAYESSRVTLKNRAESLAALIADRVLEPPKR